MTSRPYFCYVLESSDGIRRSSFVQVKALHLAVQSALSCPQYGVQLDYENQLCFLMVSLPGGKFLNILLIALLSSASSFTGSEWKAPCE